MTDHQVTLENEVKDLLEEVHKQLSDVRYADATEHLRDTCHAFAEDAKSILDRMEKTK